MIIMMHRCNPPYNHVHWTPRLQHSFHQSLSSYFYIFK